MKKYRNVPHLFYQYFNKPREMTRNHFCGVFLKQILARDIFEDVPEMSWNRHHFLRYVRDVLRRHTKDILRLHKKTSFWVYLRCLNTFSPASRWQRHRSLQGAESPCAVPTWVERTKNSPVLKTIEWTFSKC